MQNGCKTHSGKRKTKSINISLFWYSKSKTQANFLLIFSSIFYKFQIENRTHWANHFTEYTTITNLLLALPIDLMPFKVLEAGLRFGVDVCGEIVGLTYSSMLLWFVEITELLLLAAGDRFGVELPLIWRDDVLLSVFIRLCTWVGDHFECPLSVTVVDPFAVANSCDQRLSNPSLVLYPESTFCRRIFCSSDRALLLFLAAAFRRSVVWPSNPLPVRVFSSFIAIVSRNLKTCTKPRTQSCQ